MKTHILAGAGLRSVLRSLVAAQQAIDFSLVGLNMLVVTEVTGPGWTGSTQGR